MPDYAASGAASVVATVFSVVVFGIIRLYLKLRQNLFGRTGNAIEAPGIEQEGRLPNSSERRAHPIAGNDPAAK